jgi:SulP family sulfate permease
MQAKQTLNAIYARAASLQNTIYTTVTTPQFAKLTANELLIGLTLAVVVLPQAIAFSTTLAGLPPYFGIYVAIWGVLFTALLNPSRIFHGGPNSAMSAVTGVTLLPVAPQFGTDYMGYALTLFLMAGLFQVLFVLIKPIGRSLDFLSEAVINGMICGIGVFLIFKSLVAFAGLPINTEAEWPLVIAWQTFLSVLEIGNMYAIQIGLVTLVTALVVRMFEPIKNWGILCGIVAGTLYSEHLNGLHGLENTLIEQTANMSTLGFVFPSIPLLTQEAIPDIMRIVPGAVTLALLGLLQTVAAMRRMNRMVGQHVDSSKGIAGDAVSNCMLPFLSSMPTCASFNRMWLMHSMGAKTRLVAISSAFFLLALVLYFSEFIAIIPIPAMAAVIMVVGANMLNWSDIRAHLSNRVDAIVFVVSFMSIHVFGLFLAVIIGSVLALIHFKWQKSHPDVTLDGDVLKMKGSLYYGSLPVVESMFAKAISTLEHITLDMSDIYYQDPDAKRWMQAIANRSDVTIIPSRHL